MSGLTSTATSIRKYEQRCLNGIDEPRNTPDTRNKSQRILLFNFRVVRVVRD